MILLQTSRPFPWASVKGVSVHGGMLHSPPQLDSDGLFGDCWLDVRVGREESMAHHSVSWSALCLFMESGSKV